MLEINIAAYAGMQCEDGKFHHNYFKHLNLSEVFRQTNIFNISLDAMRRFQYQHLIDNAHVKIINSVFAMLSTSNRQSNTNCFDLTQQKILNFESETNKRKKCLIRNIKQMQWFHYSERYIGVEGQKISVDLHVCAALWSASFAISNEKFAFFPKARQKIACKINQWLSLGHSLAFRFDSRLRCCDVHWSWRGNGEELTLVNVRWWCLQ